MLLPNHAEATIAVEKLRDFLLDPEHEKGRSRATVLYRIGFARENWQDLETAIRRQVATHDAELSEGYKEQRYVVRGPIVGPLGSHRFWTIWMYEPGETAPRFVSAYPRS